MVFNAKDLGNSLEEVAVEVIKSEGHDIESRWFHSRKDADFFIWCDYRKNIVKQQVTYYGQVIEWNIIEGLRTGFLIEDEKSQKMGSSPIVQYDLVLQPHAVAQGVEVIHHILGLSEEIKNQVIYNFTQAPRLSSLKPEEILSRYGRRQTNKTSLMRRVWQRVLKYLIKSKD